MAKVSSKQKKIREKEKQYSQGISRKKWNHTMSAELFLLLKFVCIILIPIVYFVYSPLLILVMVLYVELFFLARLAERRLNKSVIKSNHIHISKFDSAVALTIIVFAFFGVILTNTSKTKQPTTSKKKTKKKNPSKKMAFKKISKNLRKKTF